MSSDKQAEWRRIREAEEKRRGRMGELRAAIQEEKSHRKKSAKNLLHIVIKSDGIKASSAQASLEVGDKIVHKWIQILLRKGLITTEGQKTDPILKPTDELKEKLLVYKSKKAKGDFQKALKKGINELQDKKKELLQEHQKRVKVEEEIQKKDAKLKELQDAIKHEKDLRQAIQDRMNALEKERLGADKNELEKLKKELDREHAEREKVEELLQKERERAKTEQEQLNREYEEKKKALEEREKEIVGHEQNVEDDEELDILFGDGELDEDLRKSELKLAEIHNQLREDEEKIKKGEQVPIEEIEKIIREEEEVAGLLDHEYKVLGRERAVDNLLDGIEDDDMEFLEEEDVKDALDDGMPAENLPPHAEKPVSEESGPAETTPSGPSAETIQTPAAGGSSVQTQAPPETDTDQPGEHETKEPETALRESGGSRDNEEAGGKEDGASPLKKEQAGVTEQQKTEESSEKPVKPETEGKIPKKPDEAEKPVDKQKPVKEEGEDPQIQAPVQQPLTKEEPEKRTDDGGGDGQPARPEPTRQETPPPEADAGQNPEEVSKDDVRAPKTREVEKHEMSEDERKHRLINFHVEGEPSILSLLDLMRLTDEIDFEDAKKKLNANEEQLNNWVKKLAEKNVLVAEKKMLRGAKIKLTGEVDLDGIRETVEAEKIREELRRLREAP